MLKGIAFACLLLLATLAPAQSIRKIAFGSCNNQYHAQPLWRDLIRETPDLFIWGGDNIYADTTDPSLIKEAYDLQNENLDYQFFRTVTPIIGTWDDHDFAFNNATGYYSEKLQSQDHFLNFLGEPLSSPRRYRSGIYHSYEYGPEEQKIKIILLDNRFFKDIDATAPMLGQEQWRWLEAELKDSKASLHFIVSGLSILSPKLPVSDEWADYPGELDRLLGLLSKYSPKGAMILSGDKHFASIFKRHGHLEFMSSGMTHTVSRGVRAYVGTKYPNAFFGLNYGLIEIDWEESNPILTTAVRSRSGESYLKKTFRWEDNSWSEQ